MPARFICVYILGARIREICLRRSQPLSGQIFITPKFSVSPDVFSSVSYYSFTDPFTDDSKLTTTSLSTRSGYYSGDS
jgi:hypothetical protein